MSGRPIKRTLRQRSVKLRVRPPLTGTHRCHKATPTGRGIMLTVKLTSLDQG